MTGASAAWPKRCFAAANSRASAARSRAKDGARLRGRFSICSPATERGRLSGDMHHRRSGMSRLAILLPLMCACATSAPHRNASDLPADCAGPLAASAPFEPDAWASLTGTYRLTTVQTSQGGSSLAWRESLSLQRTDSATRFARRMPMNPRSERGDRPLIGTAKSDAPNDRPTPAEYEAGRLYLGCREFQCTDASPLVYDIEWWTPDGFGGTWRDYQTGIGRVFGDRGQLLPDPAGHFCATRVPTQSAP